MSNKLNLKIQGMTCGSCSNSISVRLSKFEFTENIDVDWGTGTGSLDITENFEENKGKVLTAIGQLGYSVSE